MTPYLSDRLGVTDGIVGTKCVGMWTHGSLITPTNSVERAPHCFQAACEGEGHGPESELMD